MIRALFALGLLPALLIPAGAASAADTPAVPAPAQTCASSPDFGSAHVVPLNKDEGAWVAIDTSSPCLASAASGGAPYAVFVLPQSDAALIVSIISNPNGQNLIAPHVVIFDGQGAVSCELISSAFQFHGSSLYCGIRARSNERYVVVFPDTTSIGQSVPMISDSVYAYGMAAGTAYFTIHGGNESRSTLVYSTVGTIRVAARPIPKPE